MRAVAARLSSPIAKQLLAHARKSKGSKTMDIRCLLLDPCSDAATYCPFDESTGGDSKSSGQVRTTGRDGEQAV